MNISEMVVRRLMKQESLVAATSKRRRCGSYAGEISPAPDNVLNRDFSAGAPNEKWLTEITEFQIPAGEVYLSEMFFARDWLSTSIEEFVVAVDAYIRWYNEARIKSSLGFRSPAQHRRRLGIAA